MLLASSSVQLHLHIRLLIKSIFAISPTTALHAIFSALALTVPATAPKYLTAIWHRLAFLNACTQLASSMHIFTSNVEPFALLLVYCCSSR